jgi:putative N6-adenine-specific DNA methylase
MQMVAKTLQGLENVLAEEIKALGGAAVAPGSKAVVFAGDTLLLYRANRELRTASRILVPVHRFTAGDEAALYRGVQQLDWRRFMDLKTTFAVFAVASSSHFTHSQYAALKTKDAIVDQFRNRSGRRPSVNPLDPDLRIHLHIRGESCSLLLDSSGKPLYQRGYRTEPTAASLNEVLAAGLVLLSGWHGRTPLLDPMCGAGTILIEAALLATGTPPQHRRRHFGFMRWKDFNPETWHRAVSLGQAAGLEPIAPIWGSDISEPAMRACRRNVLNAGMQAHIRLESVALQDRGVPTVPTTLIINPPYGERMAVPDVEEFYRMIGSQLKRRFAGHTAWVLGRRTPALKAIGLRPTGQRVLFNGPIECLFQRFDLFEGSGRGKNRGAAPTAQPGQGQTR